MTDAFVAGLVAGYAVAIPLGAIGVLILGTSLRRGFPAGAAAGAGAATADAVYAAIAAVFGSAAARLLDPVAVPLRVASALVLIVIGIAGLRAAVRPVRVGPGEGGAPPSLSGTYARFVGLTIINPATVAYFAALVIGLPQMSDAAARAAFVLGVTISSLSWQWLLAAAGALVGLRSPQRFHAVTAIAGNLIVLALAAFILVDALG
jgi:threonine/homoserine/homoserine lactone efflux protein